MRTATAQGNISKPTWMTSPMQSKKVAVIQEGAFRRVHHMLGIPVKHGKEDFAQCIQAIGHEIAATSLWASLRMTDNRRESVLLKMAHALAHGFKALDVAVLAWDLDFAPSQLLVRPPGLSPEPCNMV